jgi:MFS family permease
MVEKRINRGLILLLVNAVYFFSYFQRIAVPGTIFNEIQSEFALTATAVAGLGSLTFIVYGAMQIVAGMLSDRFGGFRTFLMGGLLLGLTSTLFSFAYSPVMLFIMRVFVGFSASFIFISLVKILTVVYDAEDFPFFLSISLMMGYSGGILATYPLERAVSHMGWRNSFLIAGLICGLFALIGAPVMNRARAVYAQKKTFSLKSLFLVLKNRHSFPVALSGAMNYSVYMLFQTTIGKKYLQDSFNITSAQASFFTFVMIVTNTCFAFISGFTSRLVGLRRPFLLAANSITFVASIILFLNFSFQGGTKLVLLSYILLAVSAAVTPVYITAMKEVNELEVVSTSVGFYNSLSWLFISSTGYAAGRILDAFRHNAVEIAGIIIYPNSAYKMICLACIILSLLSFLICFSIKETGNGQKV